MPKKRPSRIPSKIPKKRPSRLPSRIPKKKPSRLPAKTPSRLAKRILTKKPAPKRLTKKDKVKIIDKEIKRAIKEKSFIFLPDLFAVLTGEVATKGAKAKLLKLGRVFTGLEARSLV